MRKQDANAGGHFDRFLNIVRHHENALQRRGLLLPERYHFVPEVFGGQDIQSTEGFVQAENFRLGHSSWAISITFFGRVNEVHVFMDEDEDSGWYIEEVIEGSTVGSVLSMTQWDQPELIGL